ncbi:MAG TPA: diacylglycerol kinase family protein [Oscillatoriaceae cyanobacterium]
MTTTPSELPPLEVTHATHPNANRTVYVVYNPTAGSGLGQKRVALDTIRDRFLAAGWNVATIRTRCAGDGTAAARLALDSGADVVAAMGGDGTINEVIQALANQPVPLGIIPVGTINVLAQELGLPSDPLAAVEAIATGAPQSIDLGKANDRYFTMMVGLGYDGVVLHNLSRELKQWSGPLAYWLTGFKTYTSYRSVRARVSWHDGKKARRLRCLIYVMIVGNTGLYAGGVLKFTPLASVRDGLFDVCIVRSKRWYQAIYHLLLALAGRLKRMPDVSQFQCTEITIRTARPLPYQIDGDPGGTTPVTIALSPRALNVMVSADTVAQGL